MNLALLDILCGKLTEQSDFESSLCESLQVHLTCLLNTRRGSLQHMPDYGLPDMTEIYKSLPYSVNQLINAIYETIAKYEPRLSQVKVQHLSNPYQDGVIHLAVQGKIFNGQKINFATYFISGAPVKILSES